MEKEENEVLRSTIADLSSQIYILKTSNEDLEHNLEETELEKERIKLELEEQY